MIRNKRLVETMFNCVKRNGECTGCFYGDGSDQPYCMLSLMNDMLFFFNNPVPSDSAHIIPIEELEGILADKQDHLAFAEFISSIHVAKPVIRSISMSANTISLYDPNTNEKDIFTKNEYYTSFRVWSAKPTDKLRNATPWESIEGSTNSPTEKTSKTNDIMRFASTRMQNISK